MLAISIVIFSHRSYTRGLYTHAARACIFIKFNLQPRFFDAPTTPITSEGLIERLAIVHIQYRYHFHGCGRPIRTKWRNLPANPNFCTITPTGLAPARPDTIHFLSGFCLVRDCLYVAEMKITIVLCNGQNSFVLLANAALLNGKAIDFRCGRLIVAFSPAKICYRTTPMVGRAVFSV